MPDNKTPPLSLSFNLPFDEAIAQALSQKVVLPDEYYGALQGLAQQKAFSVAGLTSLDQLQQVKDSLDEAISTGQSFNEWKKTVTESGILNFPRSRLDLIFRSNMQGNYLAGKWEQFIGNSANRPYLMYDAINDSRVRPSHLALDGIIRRWDDPFWKTHSPPLGYRCRCSLISLTEEQAKARSGDGKGLNQQPVYVDKDGNTQQANPDTGWDYNPSDRMAGIYRAIEAKQGKVGDVLFSALKNYLNNIPA